MKAMTVGELKADFSEVLAEVQRGEEFTVLYGRGKKPVAKIIPFVEDLEPRKIGLYKGIIKYTIGDDFKMTTEEFLGL